MTKTKQFLIWLAAALYLIRFVAIVRKVFATVNPFLRVEGASRIQRFVVKATIVVTAAFHPVLSFVVWRKQRRAKRQVRQFIDGMVAQEQDDEWDIPWPQDWVDEPYDTYPGDSIYEPTDDYVQEGPMSANEAEGLWNILFGGNCGDPECPVHGDQAGDSPVASDEPLVFYVDLGALSDLYPVDEGQAAPSEQQVYDWANEDDRNRPLFEGITILGQN